MGILNYRQDIHIEFILAVIVSCNAINVYTVFSSLIGEGK